jgi:hypothetical protein
MDVGLGGCPRVALFALASLREFEDRRQRNRVDDKVALECGSPGFDLGVRHAPLSITTLRRHIAVAPAAIPMLSPETRCCPCLSFMTQ